MGRKSSEFIFSGKTFFLLMSIWTLIAITCFVLGYQVGSLYGAKKILSQSSADRFDEATDQVFNGPEDTTGESTEVATDEYAFSFWDKMSGSDKGTSEPKKPTNKPAYTPKPNPTEKPTRRPEQTKTPVSPTPSGNTSPSATPTPGNQADASAGNYTIQVSSFTERTKAETLMKQLKSHGYPAYISDYKQGKTIHYRVRVGHFSSRDAAAKVSGQIKKTEKLDTWITSN